MAFVSPADFPPLHDLEFSAPSPPDTFDFAPASPRAPHTPSYAGSYQGSPYTSYSDLSYQGQDISEPLGLFDDDPANRTLEEYDPAEYDAPAAPDGLLMFDMRFMDAVDPRNPQLALAVSPPPNGDGAYPDPDHGSPFDHSSPGSSNGQDATSVRSRASSVSSNHHIVAVQGSPQVNFTRNFEGLTFEAPSWQPDAAGSGAALSPPHKPQSPPRLVTTSPSGVLYSGAPEINAPDGIDDMSGPQLCVVPATPVSGGGVSAPAAAAAAAYQASLQALQQGAQWDQSAQQQAAEYNFSQQGSTGQPDGSALFGNANGNTSPSEFLFPQVPRTARSKSDTSLRPPVNLWAGLGAGASSNALDDESAMGDVIATSSAGAGPSSQQQQQQQQQHHQSLHALLRSPGARPQHFPEPQAPPHLAPHFSYGPPSTAPSHTAQFLSPGDAIFAGGHLRRAKSDGGARPGHRQVRSEDFRAGGLGLGAAAYDFPPSAHQDFIRGPHTPQFLTPNGVGDVLPGLGGGVARLHGAHGGHHRRASSGSRSERGLSAGMGADALFGGVTGAGPGAGGMGAPSWSARSSPYPSPNASPRGAYEVLPLPAVGARHADASPLLGGMELAAEGDFDGGMGGGPQVQGSMAVTKQNVTTHATKDASEKRRKVDATFVCPVPGCGSTFTRHFNLKGHMRSHNEEKPYACKWPGCTKSFARQHDCKRHENLHLNIRPFTCDGCRKTFARMDALNRHLRSEGGAECQKVQAELVPVPGSEEAAEMERERAMEQMGMAGMLPMRPPTLSMSLKTEDAAWGQGGYML